MLRNPFHQVSNTTLFVKLITSFMVIVIMLVSFNFASNFYFLKNVRNEIVIANQANLSKTVNNYETHIKHIKKMGMNLFLNERVNLIVNSDQASNHYDFMYQVWKDIQSSLSDSYMMMHNIIYLLPENNIVIEKEGTRSIDEMFSDYYRSDTYSSEFWMREISGPYSFNLFAESEFSMHSFGKQQSLGKFLPVLIKNRFNNRFSLILLLDSRKMFSSFYQPTRDGKLYIMNANKETIFASDPSSDFLPASLLTSNEKSGYEKREHDYIYYQEGAESGLTYISIIPAAYIESKFTDQNRILIGVLLLSIVFSLVISIYFTASFSNPIKEILRAIQQDPLLKPRKSRIMEFDFISGRLREMLIANQDIKQDLTQKKSLLKSFSYINYLKKIHSSANDLAIQPDLEKPYIIIGFHVIYKDNNLKQLDFGEQKASYFLKELIHTYLSQSYGESLTFQIEQDLIVALIFPSENESISVMEHMEYLKRIMDMDHYYYLATLTSSLYQTDSTAFTVTYEQILKLLQLRTLGDGTQIIPFESSINNSLSTAWEKGKIKTHLEAGNNEELLRMGKQMLVYLYKKAAPLHNFIKLSHDFKRQLSQSFNEVEKNHFEERSEHDNPEHLYTFEAFERFIEDVIAAACFIIEQRKEHDEPICDFAISFVDKHYGEEISLDIIAAYLKITPSYLSSYFKEKMGVNFSDYVQTYRMKKAVELLETTDIQVQAIANRVGYHSVNSFIRNFKKFTGYPPGEYRKKYYRA